MSSNIQSVNTIAQKTYKLHPLCNMSPPHTLWDYTGLSVTRIQLPVMSLSPIIQSLC